MLGITKVLGLWEASESLFREVSFLALFRGLWKFIGEAEKVNPLGLPDVSFDGINPIEFGWLWENEIWCFLVWVVSVRLGMGTYVFGAQLSGSSLSWKSLTTSSLFLTKLTFMIPSRCQVPIQRRLAMPPSHRENVKWYSSQLLASSGINSSSSHCKIITSSHLISSFMLPPMFPPPFISQNNFSTCPSYSMPSLETRHMDTCVSIRKAMIPHHHNLSTTVAPCHLISRIQK